ncbi:MAG TPA: ribosome maturation factor RimP [Acidobacteriota bacterium]|jgi:ribosome maturation factor RimP|nr:ribosome maturation factor RimP [Acidobacteriota bacterium]
MGIADRVERLIREAVEAEGYELVHVEYLPRGAGSILRIYIDRPGGVSLDDCQQVSRHVGVLLDVEDMIPHQYVLEVSSPGIERPLFKQSDYTRFAGREIRLTTNEKIEGKKNFSGVLRGINEGIVELESEGKLRRIPFEQIRKANLVYRFGNGGVTEG